MSDIYTAVKQELDSAKTLTENGGIAYETSGSALVDLNFAVSELRSVDNDDVRSRFSKAYYENPAKAVVWMFFARDVRSGMGERRLFRLCYNWLAGIDSDTAKKLIPLVSEYGRWDDLFCLVGTPVEDDMMSFISEQLMKDNEAMKAGKNVSLLAKWMPSITTSSKETVKLARRFAGNLAMSEKIYRKTLSALRSYIDVVEVKTSGNKWGEIDYSKVCSMANLKYKDAFIAHDKSRREEYLEKLSTGEAKIHSAATFPSDIVQRYDIYSGDDETLEAMWKALPDYVEKDCIVVCDSSGSMMQPVGNTHTTAYQVALALTVYFSERMKAQSLKNKFITFSDRPRLVDMTNCGSLAEKLRFIPEYTEYSSTNIEAVFNLLLDAVVNAKIPQNEIPSIMVISDMNFNEGASRSGDTVMEAVEKRWNAAGYSLPMCIYWNVCGGQDRHAPPPVQKSKNGICLLSGFSPVISKMAVSGEIEPAKQLDSMLTSNRYKPVASIVGLA